MELFLQLLQRIGAGYLCIKGECGWWNDGKQIVFYPRIHTKAKDHLVWVYPIELVRDVVSACVQSNGHLLCQMKTGEEVLVKPMSHDELEKDGVFDVQANSLSYFQLLSKEEAPEEHAVAEIDVRGVDSYLKEDGREGSWVCFNLFAETVQLFMKKEGWIEEILPAKVFLMCDTIEEYIISMPKDILLPYIEVLCQNGIDHLKVGNFNGYIKCKVEKEEIIVVLPCEG